VVQAVLVLLTAVRAVAVVLVAQMETVEQAVLELRLVLQLMPLVVVVQVQLQVDLLEQRVKLDNQVQAVPAVLQRDKLLVQVQHHL
jgi:hypothetical protein